MCGIFALVNYINNDVNFEFKTIEKIFNEGQGRGPENSVLNPVSIDLLFGFHRLAINGLNKKSNQPITIGNITLICNGEIYNYKELYKKMGVEPKTDSDCEVIIHLYLNFGIKQMLNLLDGVFAFILLDNNPEDTKFFIARDPYGIRPMYVMQHKRKNSIFGFASEMKMLQGFISLMKTQDDYVINHVTPGCFSLFQYPIRVLSKWKMSYQEKYFNNVFSNILFLNSAMSRSVPKFSHILPILTNINTKLRSAVYKRCENTDRPVACLLSGGLDSSLICALVCEYRKKHGLSRLETYSIGIEGSEDIKHASIVAEYYNTKHTTLIISESEFLAAIPEVIRTIESYDTTTVRASIGNYLLAKHISKNSEAKVIFTGEGSDEMTGGYLYMNEAPNCIEFDRECKRLLDEIHMFDVLRCDKCISTHGLEPRVPFLDRDFSNYYMSIPIEFRYRSGSNPCFTYYKNTEKYLLRAAFDSEYIKGVEMLPRSILWRTKEAFSDGVTSQSKSLYEIIEEHVNSMEIEDKLYVNNPPATKEQLYYRNIFEQHYLGQSHVVPYYWMPKYVDAKDASARTLSIYKEHNTDLQERSL